MPSPGAAGGRHAGADALGKHACPTLRVVKACHPAVSSLRRGDGQHRKEGDSISLLEVPRDATFIRRLESTPLGTDLDRLVSFLPEQVSLATFIDSEHDSLAGTVELNRARLVAAEFARHTELIETQEDEWPPLFCTHSGERLPRRAVEDAKTLRVRAAGKDADHDQRRGPACGHRVVLPLPEQGAEGYQGSGNGSRAAFGGWLTPRGGRLLRLGSARMH